MKLIYFSLIFLLANQYCFAANIDHGKIVFKRCALCHFVDSDKNKIGPTLKGIMDRKAASVNNYHYSEAMKKAAKKGLVWTDDNLKEYLKNPHKMIPGTKMAIMFFNNKKDFEDLTAYLRSVGK